jgi:hypothetical protein
MAFSVECISNPKYLDTEEAIKTEREILCQMK